MIITPKPSDPEVQILSEEFKKRGYEIQYFVPSSVKVRIENSSFGDFFDNLDLVENERLDIRNFIEAVSEKVI